MIRIVAAFSSAVALAGCTAFPAAPGAPSARESHESRQVVELIGYTQKVAALQAEEQQRELNASSQIFTKDRGAYGRVRLALLLALPGTAFSDDAKAAGLLESLAGTGTSESPPGPMQQFAGLLHAQISERLREQRRTAQLKEQLEALKAVERKIIEREQARPR
jgi:TolA-binding protein